MDSQRLAEIRQLLAEPPSWEAWNGLVAILDSLKDSEQPMALEYVKSHLTTAWPTRWCVSNAAWAKKSVGHQLVQGERCEISSLPGAHEVWCPPARFQVGAEQDDPHRGEEELPQQWVTLTRGFWMQTTMVTQQQWHSITLKNPTQLERDDPRPIDSINWFDAVAFCNALSRREGLKEAYTIVLPEGDSEYFFPPASVTQEAKVFWNGWDCEGYRLPFEVEWEWAARAGLPGSYYGEEETLDSIAWTDLNSDHGTRPVATKEPNAWGLYDMLGNLWEWCNDTCENDPTPEPWPSTPMMDHAPFSNEHSCAVLRGGCWVQEPDVARFCSRASDHKGLADEYAGLRVCRTGMI